MGKKSGPDLPPTPDYQGLAEQQSALQQQNLQQQTYANRPNQYSPWGSTTWGTSQVRDPVTGQMVTQWEQQNKLDPKMQGLLDQQLGLQRGQLSNERRLNAANYDRAYMADVMGNRLRGKQFLGSNVDYDQFRDIRDVEDVPGLRDRAEDAVYGRMTSRLDPRFEESGEALQARLRNQGLRPGDEAYDREMANFDRGKTDAYQAAMMESVGAGRAEAGQMFDQQAQRQQMDAMVRNQEIAEALRKRSQPLTDMNALMAGVPTTPGMRPNLAQMPGFASTGQAATPQLMSAAQQGYRGNVDAYNASQANRQSGMSGLFGLASAALPLIPGFPG